MKNLIGMLGILVAMVCLGMGCNKEEFNSAWTPSSVGPDTLSIKIGKSAVSSAGEKLTFDELVHDSRCPANAMCIWQGMVTVNMSADFPAGRQEFTLSTDPNKPEEISAIVYGYQVNLLNVFPYPGTEENVEPDDYVVEIAVKKIDY